MQNLWVGHELCCNTTSSSSFLIISLFVCSIGIVFKSLTWICYLWMFPHFCPPPPPIIILSVAVTLADVVSSYFVWSLFSIRVIRIPVCMAVYPQVWCVICCVDFCRCISYPYLKLLLYFIYSFLFCFVFVCTCWWHIALLLSCLYLHLFFCGLNGLDVAHKLLTILFRMSFLLCTPVLLFSASVQFTERAWLLCEVFCTWSIKLYILSYTFVTFLTLYILPETV